MNKRASILTVMVTCPGNNAVGGARSGPNRPAAEGNAASGGKGRGAGPPGRKGDGRRRLTPARFCKRCVISSNPSNSSLTRPRSPTTRSTRAARNSSMSIDMETFVQRPDRLRVNAEGDLVDKQFYFDGKTITLYDKDHNVYGILEVPPDIESALEKANKEFGVRVALTDLASPNLWEFLNKHIKHSLYVGLSKVRGVPCHHLAFDGAVAHVQVWIEAGDKPLPRKVVMTAEKAPGSPEWMAYLYDWNLSPQLQDNLFVFTPPEGAQKIKFIPVKTGPAPKTKAGKKGGKS